MSDSPLNQHRFHEVDIMSDNDIPFPEMDSDPASGVRENDAMIDETRSDGSERGDENHSSDEQHRSSSRSDDDLQQVSGKKIREPKPSGEDMDYEPLALPFFVLLVVFALGFAVVSSAYVTTGDEDETELEGLRIEEVFFMHTGMQEDTITIDIHIFLTNMGEKDAKSIRISAKAENQKNSITYAKGEALIPEIKGEKTTLSIISIALAKNQSFTINILVFEDGMLKKQGSGEVQTGEINQSAKEFVADDNLVSGDEENDAALSDGFIPGFELIPLAAAFTAAGILLYPGKRRWRYD